MDFKPFKIGKYLLLEKIATGGMAEVYRAKASGAGGFEKQLAIKRILPNYASNEEFRRMFEYEARLSSMLTHANIAQIYDFVKHGETYLLAMEFIDGKNLRQFINKAKKMNFVPPPEFGLFIINEVCKGLEYAHKRKDDLTGKSLNIIHRDMSPQNIMLSYDGAVKIVDFGIAKAKDRVDETRSGVIKGKFGYMSPEQANGEQIDHRTDIFSTGIILYELLANRRLFAGDNDMATLRQIQECVVPSAARQNPKITSEMEKIMMKSLTKDLGLRYHDAGRFHRGLQEYLNKNFSSFSQVEMGAILQKIFADEIVAEKKRFEAVYRQSIPFSQKATLEAGQRGEEEFPEANDDDEPATKSETRNRSVVTNLSGEELVTSISGIYEKEKQERKIEPRSPLSEEESQVDSELSPLTQVDSMLPEDMDDPQTAGGTGTFRPSIAEPTPNPPTQVKTASTFGRSRTSSGIERTKVTGSTAKNDEGTTQITDSRVKEAQAPKEPEGDLASASGISLHDTAAGEKNRRRDRSFSVSHGISTSGGNQNVSLQSYGRGNELEGLDRQMGDQRRYRDPYTFVAKRRGSPLLKFFLLIILFGLGAVLLNKEKEKQGVEPRLPAEDIEQDEVPLPAKGRVRASERTPQNQAATPGVLGSCSFEVSTDPPGAAIFIDRQSRGLSPTVVNAACDKGADLTLVLEGYADIQENIFVKRKMKGLKRSLKRVDMGAIEMTTNGNAEVYINGRLVAEVAANTPFEKKLRAGRTYQLRFVNQVLKHDFTCSIAVETDKIEVKKIDIAQGKCK